jgi:CspA family cold shock protein
VRKVASSRRRTPAEATLAAQEGTQQQMPTTGQIKRLVRDRGFGFIRPEGASEDIFFHSSAVQGTMFDELNEGQNVEFDKENDPRDSRRSRAVNIRVTG